MQRERLKEHHMGLTEDSKSEGECSSDLRALADTHSATHERLSKLQRTSRWQCVWNIVGYSNLDRCLQRVVGVRKCMAHTHTHTHTHTVENERTLNHEEKNEK